MKNWTIGKRIITGGVVLIVLLFVVAGVAASALTNLERFAGVRLRDDAIPGMVYVSDMTVFALRGYIRAIVAGVRPSPRRATRTSPKVRKMSPRSRRP